MKKAILSTFLMGAISASFVSCKGDTDKVKEKAEDVKGLVPEGAELNNHMYI